jgi:hypothetical protein
MVRPSAFAVLRLTASSNFSAKAACTVLCGGRAMSTLGIVRRHMVRAGPYEVEARACPLRQLQKTHGGVGVLPYLPPEQLATLLALAGVTAITGYF